MTLHKERLMESYIEQLKAEAQAANLQMLQAFRLSDVPTSTYYRTLAGGELRLATANKVLNAIRVYALQQTKDH